MNADQRKRRHLREVLKMQLVAAALGALSIMGALTIAVTGASQAVNESTAVVVADPVTRTAVSSRPPTMPFAAPPMKAAPFAGGDKHGWPGTGPFWGGDWPGPGPK
jgi:hypothetical protein